MTRLLSLLLSTRLSSLKLQLAQLIALKTLPIYQEFGVNKSYCERNKGFSSVTVGLSEDVLDLIQMLCVSMRNRPQSRLNNIRMSENKPKQTTVRVRNKISARTNDGGQKESAAPVWLENLRSEVPPPLPLSALFTPHFCYIPTCLLTLNRFSNTKSELGSLGFKKKGGPPDALMVAYNIDHETLGTHLTIQISGQNRTMTHFIFDWSWY